MQWIKPKFSTKWGRPNNIDSVIGNHREIKSCTKAVGKYWISTQRPLLGKQ
jgi:hypothetical protein